jgi:glycosyltransferase involved in cell wall biosynthesis
MATNKWTGAATGNNSWDVAKNWSRGTLPDSTSSVVISKSGTYSVTIASSDPAYTVRRLSLSGTGSHTLVVDGALTVVQGATLNGSNLDVAASGTINLDRITLHGAATVSDEGTLDVSNAFAGAGNTVQVDGGNLFAGSLTGSNAFVLSAGGNLTVGDSVSNGSAIQFGDNQGDMLTLGQSTPTFAGQITGFGAGDNIDLSSLTFQSGYTTSYSGSTLTISDGGTTVFTFSNINDPGTVTLADDGSGGTMIACYLAGTQILTEQGEVAVESLSIGDRVMTHSGVARPIKWIGRRSYTGAHAVTAADLAPVLIRAGALADGVPVRDLYVSREHALYLDGVLVPARELVNGASIVVTEGVDPIRYFHIELDTHDVIFAEGAAAETFVDCDSRSMFQNADEFAPLYPDDASPRWQFCAPVVESGEQLAAIQRRLLARALRDRDVLAQGGPVRGFLEHVSHNTISAWAYLESHPNIAVRLEVLDNGVKIAEGLANHYRQDLEADGIGDGRHAFRVHLSQPLDPLTRHEIVVRHAADGKELSQSPAILEQVAALDVSAQTALKSLLDNLVARAATLRETETVLQLLAGATSRARSTQAAVTAPLLPVRRGGTTAAAQRALVIDTDWPRRVRDAGSQAILSHMRSLQQLGWQVELVASSDPEAAEDLAQLRDAGIFCHTAPWATSVEEVLRRRTSRYDLVYLHRARNALAYAGLAREYQPAARLIYSVADLHFLRLAREAHVEERPELLREARAQCGREVMAARLVDAVLTHSPYEANLLDRLVPGALVHVVPWAVSPQPQPATWEERSGLAFVGNFGHRPNLDAVHWLASEVMPLVWQQHPELPCMIAGGGMPQQLARTIAEPRVQLLGSVGDLAEVYGRVRLAVAPLRVGAGIKGKVLEAFAAGLPCVITPIAAEGLPLLDTLSALVADDAATMARRICWLHEDAIDNARLGQAGLAMLCRHFNEATVRMALTEALASAAQARVAAEAKEPAASIALQHRAAA